MAGGIMLVMPAQSSLTDWRRTKYYSDMLVTWHKILHISLDFDVFHVPCISETHEVHAGPTDAVHFM